MLDIANITPSDIISHLPDHSPSFWGWHQDDPNIYGDDLVTLLNFQSYIDDPTLIKDLMVQQGVTDVESVEIDGRQSGGSSANNYKGYIHWTDGTETKVLVKGRRAGETVTASYRESLFYSRLAEGVMDYAKVPEHYLAVADISNGDALFIEQFADGYTSMQDIYVAYATGTLDDYGIDPSTFDYLESNKDVMRQMANWSYSHWMDESLFTEWWMKNYDEVSGHGRYDMGCQKKWVQELWHRTKKAVNDPTSGVTLNQNTQDCIQAVIDSWTLASVEDLWNEPTYVWGLTHGDFHPGQLLANNTNLTDIIIADFEFVGVKGHPVVDIVTWNSEILPSYLEKHEEELLFAYYMGLLSAGVSPSDLSFEQFWEDYKVLGFAHMTARWIYVSGLTPARPSEQGLYIMLEKFVERHDLTPEQMKPPPYGAFDLEC